METELADRLSEIESRLATIEGWKELLGVIAKNTVYNGRYATKDDIKAVAKMLGIFQWTVSVLGALLVALVGLALSRGG